MATVLLYREMPGTRDATDLGPSAAPSRTLYHRSGGKLEIVPA
jgi:hypothetical protein